MLPRVGRWEASGASFPQGLSPNEAGRSRQFWEEFTRAAGVATVRELSREHFAKYEATVRAAKLAPKSALHRYRKIQTVLACAIKRGVGVEDSPRGRGPTASRAASAAGSASRMWPRSAP